ncbi:MAG: hypothetical protein U0517_00445 [Candidatus Andersenbacteria bacterium]
MQTTLARVSQDVALVRNARVVIRLHATDVSIEHHPTSRLNLVAVIGPAQFQGQSFSEAILLEIGIGHAEPYHRLYPLLEPSDRCGIKQPSERPKQRRLSFRSPKRLSFRARQRLGSLTEQQYRLLAPYLFQAIQSVANQAIDRWASGPTRRLMCKRTYFSRRRQGNYTGLVPVEIDWGKRFHIHPEDVLPLADALWCAAENERRSLKLRAGYVHVRLSAATKREPRDFSRSSAYKQIREYLEQARLQAWQVQEVLNHMRKWNRHRLWHELSDLMGANGDLREAALLNTARALGDPRRRLFCPPRMRITKGRSSYVCDVFSSSTIAQGRIK